MKYVTIGIGFKSGNYKEYDFEIEPHEITEMKDFLSSINSEVFNFFEGYTDANKTITFSIHNRHFTIPMSSIEWFSIDGLEEL